MALSSLDLSAATCMKLYKAYGSAAADIVRENPYQLIADVFGIGFRKAVFPSICVLAAGLLLLWLFKHTVPVFIGSLLMMCGFLSGMAVFGTILFMILFYSIHRVLCKKKVCL